jgi:hypothetical protein
MRGPGPPGSSNESAAHRQERVAAHMAYQVPAANQSIGQDQFQFGPTTGEEYSVRKAKLLKLSQIAALTSNDSAIAFFAGSDETQTAYINDLDLEQFQGLVAAWRADSGVTAGE